jgi:hypothetical protein
MMVREMRERMKLLTLKEMWYEVLNTPGLITMMMHNYNFLKQLSVNHHQEKLVVKNITI